VASKSAYRDSEKGADIEAALDELEKLIDRVKVLYEQYFLGIQKQAPNYLHTDAERKIRDLTQLQIRNTALRYRFTTLQQKYGSYNAYWRRTMRQIENGTYARSLSKIGRKAAQKGQDIPEEILAAMPKHMRDQVRRDRELAIAVDKSHKAAAVEVPVDEFEDESTTDVSSRLPVRPKVDPRGAHVLSEADGDLDVESMFAAIADQTTGTMPPPMKNLTPRGPIPGIPQTGAPPPVQVSFRPVTTPPPLAPSAPAVPTAPAAIRGAMMAAAPSRPRSPSDRPSVPSIPAVVPPPRPPVRAATEGGPPVVPPPRPPPRPAPATAPGGMTDAEVRALHATYVKAKAMVGEAPEDNSYAKLVKTISQQAPKIMEQYKAKGVEFTVVVKDKQVIIRAKPKT
jgi:hypothetical protein